MVNHRVEETPQKIEDNDFAIDETTQSVPEQQQALTETKNLPSRQGRKRERSAERTNVDGDGDESKNKKKQRLSRSVSRFSRSVQPLHVVVPGEGLRDSAQKKKAIKLAKKASKKRNKAACRGEADRVIVNLKPRHLFSGKRPKGKKHQR